MKAYEFSAQVTPNGLLKLPESALAELDLEQVVRVIVLVQEPADAEEVQAWSSRASEQFLSGHSPEDVLRDSP